MCLLDVFHTQIESGEPGGRNSYYSFSQAELNFTWKPCAFMFTSANETKYKKELRKMVNVTHEHKVPCLIMCPILIQCVEFFHALKNWQRIFPLSQKPHYKGLNLTQPRVRNDVARGCHVLGLSLENYWEHPLWENAHFFFI